jgi:ESCRT-II complex subunit VPS36
MGGMMTLAEAFCRVNRARGLELLSPEDMLRACELMASLQLPVAIRTFDSGVKVLQLPSHSDDSIAKVTANAVSEILKREKKHTLKNIVIIVLVG